MIIRGRVRGDLDVHVTRIGQGFKGTAVFTAGGNTVATEGTGGTKNAAKNMAAKAILQKIRDDIESTDH